MRDRSGRWRTPGYQGRFIDALASQCESVACYLHTPRADEEEWMDYTVQSPNACFIHIGRHDSVPSRLWNADRYCAALKTSASDLDAILLRGPSPLLPAMARAAGVTPVALLLVGDYVASLKCLRQPPVRKLGIACFAWWNQRQERRIARETLTFVNSRELLEQLKGRTPALHEIRTTTITAEDLFERVDTCTQRPIRLLFAGRLCHEKGLADIVTAVAQVVRGGTDAVLRLAGAPERGTNIVDDLKRLASELEIADRLEFVGYKGAGPDLFTEYRNADIFVTASRASEGFPRTIWEAMASSVPVIGTAVGSIPLLLSDGLTALLVPPRNPGALAAAILRVVRDSALRARLIRNGRALAGHCTLEETVRELVSILDSWITRPAVALV